MKSRKEKRLFKNKNHLLTANGVGLDAKKPFFGNILTDIKLGLWAWSGRNHQKRSKHGITGKTIEISQYGRVTNGKGNFEKFWKNRRDAIGHVPSHDSLSKLVTGNYAVGKTGRERLRTEHDNKYIVLKDVEMKRYWELSDSILDREAWRVEADRSKDWRPKEEKGRVVIDLQGRGSDKNRVADYYTLERWNQS